MVGDAGDGGEEKEVDVKTNVVQGRSREAKQRNDSPASKTAVITITSILTIDLFLMSFSV